MAMGLLAHPLFGWFATGHTEITMWAVSAAISVLNARGLLERMRTGTTRMKIHLSGLWLMNVCQDIDEGNILGKCGIEVPGGQVAHFMRDTGQAQAVAYSKAYKRIWDESYHSWTWFQKAFPEKKPEHHRGGFLGALESAYDHTVGAVVGGVKEVVEEAEMVPAQIHLARALHAFQDSFSPAHTLRDVGSGVISDVYVWDESNKKQHGDWPGHWNNDLTGYSELTKHWRTECEHASCDLIVAVLSTLYDGQSAWIGAMRNVLANHLKKSF
jgi:hypothetical protein